MIGITNWIAPACAAMTPPAGYQLPIRGFGKLWCDLALWGTVGWPAENEAGVTLLVQRTQRGRVLKTSVSGRVFLIAINPTAGRAVTLISGP